MAEFLSNLNSCPASSVPLGRKFNANGFVWSDLRNRLSVDKIEKLVKLKTCYHYCNNKN